ncbi:hypothetical protein AKO1_015658 [Acrasis kona]|uniref:Threonylcarbamoyl-AMP synthase n=1 Tax=Acrasis kona TaxID=1008807 RepID=A0AAW2YKZ6_9EUKA
MNNNNTNNDNINMTQDAYVDAFLESIDLHSPLDPFSEFNPDALGNYFLPQTTTSTEYAHNSLNTNIQPQNTNFTQNNQHDDTAVSYRSINSQHQSTYYSTSSAPITPRTKTPSIKTRSRSHPNNTSPYSTINVLDALLSHNHSQSHHGQQPHQKVTTDNHTGESFLDKVPSNAFYSTNTTSNPTLITNPINNQVQSERNFYEGFWFQNKTPPTSPVTPTIASLFSIKQNEPVEVRTSPPHDKPLTPTSEHEGKRKILTVRRGKYKRSTKIRGYEGMTAEFKFN